MAFIPTLTTPLLTRHLATTSRRFSRLQPSKMSLRADLDHVALSCVDQKRMHTFYATVLNFPPEQLDAPFPSVRVSDITILDFLRGQEAGFSNGTHMCFSIRKEDFGGLKERLSAVGIDVGEPVKRGGARGEGWCVYVKDPEGNLLEFRWYE